MQVSSAFSFFCFALVFIPLYLTSYNIESYKSSINDWLMFTTLFPISKIETVRQPKHKMHKNLQTFCKLVIQTYGQCWSENIEEFRETTLFHQILLFHISFVVFYGFSYCVRFNFSKLFYMNFSLIFPPIFSFNQYHLCIT